MALAASVFLIWRGQQLDDSFGRLITAGEIDQAGRELGIPVVVQVHRDPCRPSMASSRPSPYDPIDFLTLLGRHSPA